jgi:hypothetical protein
VIRGAAQDVELLELHPRGSEPDDTVAHALHERRQETQHER